MTSSCDDDSSTSVPDPLQLVSVNVGTQNLSFTQVNTNTPIDKPVVVWFSQPLDTTTVWNNVKLLDNRGNALGVNYSYLDDFKAVSMLPNNPLIENNLPSFSL